MRIDWSCGSASRGFRSSPIREFAAALSLTAIAIFVGCSPNSGSDSTRSSETPRNVTLTAAQQKNIRLYTVEPSAFRKTIETAGVVDFDNDQATSVLAPFSGPVSRLFVSPGERVKRGETLAMVDSPDFAAAVSAYRKALSAAQTSRRLANLDKDLVQHNGVSQREADQAETDAVSAEADRAAALQALVSLNVDAQTIENIKQGRPIARAAGAIRSPIAGTVVEKLITPGQLLQAGVTPCFTVADLSRVWVMAQVFGSDLASVNIGDPAEVMMGGGAKGLSGRVDNISAQVSPDTRSVAVRVAAENPANLLKKQMYVRVEIQSRQQNSGFLVPVSAILRDDENLPFVYVAQRDGGFARQHVTLAERTADKYHVASGLQAGERVVVDGAIFVQFLQDQ